MAAATIISPLRAPNGRLKGYDLLMDGNKISMSCEEIKAQLRARTLSVEGMTINSAGALILKNSPDKSGLHRVKAEESHQSGTSADIPDKTDSSTPPGKRIMDEPVRISSLLEPYQKNYRAASEKNGPSGKNVAFVKRRII